MDNKTGWSVGDIIGLLIIAGIFGGFNGFGYGNNARTDISNEFLYNQMANDIRANGTAINTTDRDVLISSCNTDKEVMNNRFNCSQNACNTQKEVLENRYANSIGFANIDKDLLLGNQSILSNQSSCCCELKTAIHSEAEQTRALIQENTIQALRDKIADKDREALATGLSYSTSLSVRNAKDEILNSLGNYYPKMGVNPYNIYPSYYSYGTTIQ